MFKMRAETQRTGLSQRPSPSRVVVLGVEPINRSRFVALARGADQDRFEVRALPPEDYLAVALPNVSGAEWTAPEFLPALRSLATSFTLLEGESKVLALKLRARP